MTDAVLSGQKNVVLLLFLFFLALGSFFRVYELGERSLWTDEAWVALAATQSTPTAVLQEGKSTPPLYLLSVWGLAQFFGGNETVLRLISCLLGLGTLVLFWPLAKALLPPWSALVAFTLVSISNRLVYFSKELKQYSADIFFAVVVFLLVERQLRRHGQKGWLLFTIPLALGLGFSHPLVFILPVAALVLWWKLPLARRPIIFSFGALGLIFFGYYWLFFQGQVDPELLIYWQEDFPDLTCGTNFFCWLGGGWSRFGRYFFSDWGAPLGLIFAVVGLGYFFRNYQSRVIWYFFGPILVALAAAFAERYPFMGHAGGVRLMMFSAPMLYLVTGAGIATIFAWLWQRQSSAENFPNGLVTPEQDLQPVPEAKRIRTKAYGQSFRIGLIIYVGIVLIWLQPGELWQENLHPQANREEIAPLVHYVQTHQRPGDTIYVYYFAIYPFKFYYQGPQDHIIWGQSCHDRCLPLPQKDLRQIKRLWMIFAHFETEAEVDGFIVNLLGPGWIRHFELSQPGALLFCYLPSWAETATAGDIINSPGP